ncbi:MAG: hypothetical protein AAFR61_25580 [Bacteroidota bacterium]
MKKSLSAFLLGCLFLSSSLLSAQSGFGLRFASNINYFPRGDEHQLVEHFYTTGILGFFFSNYKERHGFELGLNVVYKNGDDKGLPNFPVVMRDFGLGGENVGITSAEMDLKVGPRFGFVNPKIGYVIGYRFQQTGFLKDGLDQGIVNWYLMLPFGASVNLPTNYGSVGFGAYYNVGLLNVLKNPGPGTGSIYDGGRQRYINFEIVVTMDRF